ncbi:uncharacterized protein LOC114308396 isoform X2 [Camellia sinensis]|uniref:uncharacterized protein LOC114308396 isoform X2 n=1 Tax=Camellia sinensis TaxID=4442 RepID=UPI0010369CEF|nr:uncharacterized protein LOC114308396 isoform X2 [Camellia sinensis]
MCRERKRVLEREREYEECIEIERETQDLAWILQDCAKIRVNEGFRSDAASYSRNSRSQLDLCQFHFMELLFAVLMAIIYDFSVFRTVCSVFMTVCIVLLLDVPRDQVHEGT